MKKPFIPVVLGTAREGRVSETVARYVVQQIAASGLCETQLVDVKDFLFGKTAVYAEQTEPWKALMAKADGLVIVSPEYNRGIPGELKIMIDSLVKEYDKKPVALVGVSSGSWGGSRMAEQVLPTLVALGMIPVGPAVLFPRAQELFTPTGEVLDASYDSKIAALIAKLVTFAETLAPARTTAENKQ